MKRLFLVIGLFFSSYYCIAQRYGNERLYDFGLADSKELSHSLSIAIPCLVIGFIICWVTMWGRPEAQNKSDDKVSYFGCGGCLIMAIGGFFLLPLLAYVELAGKIIFYIVLIIVSIFAIYNWIKNKLK